MELIEEENTEDEEVRYLFDFACNNTCESHFQSLFEFANKSRGFSAFLLGPKIPPPFPIENSHIFSNSMSDFPN